MPRRLLLGLFLLVAAFTCTFASAADPPLSDRELVLGLRVAPPFAMKAPDGIWTGISVELWRHLAEQMKLRFRFQETTQDGLLQDLAGGTLDASGAALAITPDRLAQVDFSTPYFSTGLGVVVPQTGRLDWMGIALSFLSTNFLTVLGIVIGTIVLVALIVWLIERRKNPPYGGPPADGLICSVTYTMQTMARANPTRLAPKTKPGRLLGAGWAVASVGVVAIFTAAITSHLTARELQGLIRDAADLHHARVGTVGDAVALSYLSREGIAHQDFPTLEAAVQAVADGKLDAVVYEKPRLSWLVQRDHPIELQVLPLNLDPQSYAIALPYGSPLRQPLNIALVEATRTSWWRELVGRYLGGE
jgi:ABC-type amino acid transport substrate-binding protein